MQMICYSRSCGCWQNQVIPQEVYLIGEAFRISARAELMRHALSQALRKSAKCTRADGDFCQKFGGLT